MIKNLIPVFILFDWTVRSNPTGPKVLLFDLFNNTIGLILGVGVPLFFVFAIFYRRLWDIDVIIRKTLVYGVLTGALLASYFGLVITFQKISQWIIGENQPPITTVLSTLVIAALFSPLRKLILNAIDRRFYRRKYDAERILQAFTVSLREEVDLDMLNYHIGSVINETIQPESASLWLSKAGKYPSDEDQ